MFQKALIADDLDSITTGVFNALTAAGVCSIDTAQYCDDAYLKIKAGIHKNQPFDLLITDLSFVPDHRNQEIENGESLTQIIKKEHPELPVIVYTVEDRLPRVRSLMEKHYAAAYVCKGRHGLKELMQAITLVAEGKTYLSPQVAGALKPTTTMEIKDYDILLLKMLASGLSQDEMAASLKEQHIKPASLSAIEKQLQLLRIRFKAKNAAQLVANAKDLGVI